MLRPSTSSRGFTLIEIMIVVAIIGVLASIAIPNYQGFICKAKQTESKGLLKGVYVAQLAYHNEENFFLCTLDDLRILGGIEYQSTQYNLMTNVCVPGPPDGFSVTMTSRFTGPGGQDVWQMTDDGTLLHLNNGCH